LRLHLFLRSFFPSDWIIAIGPVQEENMYVCFCPVFGLGGAFVLDFTRLG
jgi:hypothetical protein